jgi:hypothetical protein
MVIALGQWALSDAVKKKPIDPDTWINQMKTIVDDIHNNSNMTIILRSIHYHSLGYTILSCPPEDWRLPYLIDVYNEKLAEFAEKHPAFQKEHNRFIDTNPVVGAVWDTWEDWNHVWFKVGNPEARYILNQMTGDTSSTNTSTLVAEDLPSGSESGLSNGMPVPAGASDYGVLVPLSKRITGEVEGGMLPEYTFQLLLFSLLPMYLLVYLRRRKKCLKIYC